MLACYKIFKTPLGYYRFKLVDLNEKETIFRSVQEYTSKEECKKVIELCREISTENSSYVRRFLGRNFFKLCDKNGRDIAISEMLTTTYSRELAITAAKKHGPTLNVMDDSEKECC